MDLTLEGKTLLITGASQGLGADIAAEAARRGVDAVALAARSRDKGEAVVERLRAHGVRARFFTTDLIRPEAPALLFSEVLGWAGRLDGLVNSAGSTARASFLDGTNDVWESLFALNARAPFFLMQAHIRHLRDRGAAGSIVNIQSMNAHCGAPDLAIYSASKGALAVMTRNAANAHLADRIRVNGINMGWAPTAGEQVTQGEVLGKGRGWQDEAAAHMPLGRLLCPAEVARLCTYLLSDYSGLQTGTWVDLEQRVVGAP